MSKGQHGEYLPTPKEIREHKARIDAENYPERLAKKRLEDDCDADLEAEADRKARRGK